MSLWKEIPISGMRQAARTKLWELGRGSYTWQQVVIRQVISRFYGLGNPVLPLLAADVQASIDTCYGMAMAFDFDNPPVAWFNDNQNSIGGWSHAFNPPPLCQVIGADNLSGAFGSAPVYQPSNNSTPFGYPGDFNIWLFDPAGGGYTFTSPVGRGPICLTDFQANGGDGVENVGFCTVTRIRIIASSPTCVSVKSLDHTGYSLISCGIEDGSNFDPLSTVPDIVDPLPNFFHYANEKRVWASNPNAIACTDCTCP